MKEVQQTALQKQQELEDSLDYIKNSDTEDVESEIDKVARELREHKTYEEAMAGINEMLEKMGLDYLDMMIIHSPQPWAKVNQCEDRYVEGNRAAWKALEDAEDELRRLENLQNARKELERTQGEKTVSQKMFKAI